MAEDHVAPAVLTLREIADQYGYSLSHVRRLALTDPTWPDPVGTATPVGHAGGPAHTYDAGAISAWIAEHRPAGDRWTARRIAAELGITRDTIRSARRRGTMPEPDGRIDRLPWWHEATVRAWWSATRRPADSWVLNDLRRVTGLQDPTRQRGFPEPDGGTARMRWWHPTTVVGWLAQQR